MNYPIQAMVIDYPLSCSVCYSGNGNRLFCSVSYSGNGNRLSYSVHCVNIKAVKLLINIDCYFYIWIVKEGIIFIFADSATKENIFSVVNPRTYETMLTNLYIYIYITHKRTTVKLK